MHADEGDRSKTYCYHPVKKWRAGEWHHVACAWTRREGMALYIDGKQVRYLAGVSLATRPVKPDMTLGSDWQRKGKRTVIDEVMIFERMLAPHEIATLASKEVGVPSADVPRDIPGVALAHAILGQQVLARVYRDALGEPFAERARLTLSPKGQSKVVAETTTGLTESLNTIGLDLTPLPRGVYEAKLALLSNGAVRGVESLSASKETDETWETAAKIGKEDTVLPPFTPLTVKGNRVSCYGRAYEFDGSGLLAKMRSQDQDMLARPVRVVATGADGSVTLSPGQLTTGSVSATEATLSGTQHASSLDIDATATARYDGTVWTTLRLRPQTATTLKSLRIEIPMASDQAKYLAYIGLARIGDKRLGYDALPAGQGVVWRREFLPSVWLGTEERGLGWYAERDEHWDTDGEGALTVERRENAAVLCMNVIRRPREIVKEFSIEFGLQATPVRPLSPDWRSYQWVPSTDITRFFLHLRKRPYPRPELAGKRPRGKVCYLYTYHSHFTCTLPKDPGEFREMARRVKQYGVLGVPYTDVNFFPESFGDLWLKGNSMHATPGARATTYGPVCNIATCHTGPYSDWYVWYVSHLVREYGINGVYLDEMWCYGCADPSHGCGYVGLDGKRRLTYPLRAQNETYRRVRAVLAATGEPFHIAYHISGGRFSPLATFGDSHLVGEDRYHHVRKNPDYTSNMTAAQWRAGYSTEAWGIPAVFLPQFKMRKDWMKSNDLAAKLMAAAVPHDVMIWPAFAKAETIMEVRDALERFGIGQPDTQFLPYWQRNTGLSVSDPRIKLSAYARPGKLLLCIANWSSDEIQDLVIKLDPSAVDLPTRIGGRDAADGKPVAVHGHRLTISIPPKRVRLVEVRP